LKVFNGLVIFWKVYWLGNVFEMFWKCFLAWNCLGNCLEMCWKCLLAP